MTRFDYMAWVYKNCMHILCKISFSLLMTQIFMNIGTVLEALPGH